MQHSFLPEIAKGIRFSRTAPGFSLENLTPGFSALDLMEDFGDAPQSGLQDA
jgi:hypothetical protein